MDPLTETERQFLALAIQGLCMRQGPFLFPLAAQLAEKLGILEEFRYSFQDWTTYSPRWGRRGKRKM